MSILSFSFICCFILLLILHWLLPEKWRNPILLLASWLYIVSWNWIYLIFLVAAVVISFAAGRLIARSKDTGNRSIMYLSGGIVILLGILVVVKYTPVMIQVLGISFFTFQAVSYIVNSAKKLH